MTQTERIDRTLEAAAWEYGKVGLLVDDSPEFLMRVARALYGAEALPKWWTSAKSIECGAAALAKVLKLLHDRNFRRLKVFILVDRYLPLKCGGGPAIAWHGGSEKTPPDEVVALNRHVLDIVGKASRRVEQGWSEDSKCLIRFVTSFPMVTLGSGDATGIDWQMRSVELLQEERRAFMDSRSWECMLRYGPEEGARIAREGEKPPEWLAATADSARWRARKWHQTLSNLAKIINGKRAILLTGAGASLSVGAAGPGMLGTNEIVERVGRAIDHGGEEPLPMPEVAPCSCRDRAASSVSGPGVEAEPLPAHATPIERLLSREENKFKLEEIFSPNLHETSKDLFKDFHRLFRRELYKRDFGCSFHHWLMARFPWKAIITTNFDGFHERASASVARVLSGDEEARLWVLSLGSVGRPEDWSGEESNPHGLGKSRLFKPYGSLYSPLGELALSGKDVEAFQDELEKALGTVLKDPADTGRRALVVVGQSMRNELVERALTNLKDKLRECELVWVDPHAYDLCHTITHEESTLWERWVADRMRGGNYQKSAVYLSAEHLGAEACSGPIPATALEFIYDLWMVFQSG